LASFSLSRCASEEQVAVVDKANKRGETRQQKEPIAHGHPPQRRTLDTDTEYQKVQVASAHLRA